SNSPAPRRRADYSVSPRRRPEDHSRSPIPNSRERDGDHPRRRSYSPGYVDTDRIPADGKPVYVAVEDAPPAEWRLRSPGRASRSPSGSRSRSADLSPRRRR
ncbi:hypothetical protein MKW94_030354, partial [Papaver nudicaule]|nr:hypothetical protein [Papaver nudicaule]